MCLEAWLMLWWFISPSSCVPPPDLAWTLPMSIGGSAPRSLQVLQQWVAGRRSGLTIHQWWVANTTGAIVWLCRWVPNVGGYLPYMNYVGRIMIHDMYIKVYIITIYYFIGYLTYLFVLSLFIWEFSSSPARIICFLWTWDCLNVGCWRYCQPRMTQARNMLLSETTIFWPQALNLLVCIWHWEDLWSEWTFFSFSRPASSAQIEVSIW